MSDAKTNEPERTHRSLEPDTRTSSASNATDGDAFRPGFTDTPRIPAQTGGVDGMAAPDDETTLPWSGWQPDEQFGQGDEGFGEDA